MDFEINLVFQIKLFFLRDQKVKTKILISWEQKKLLRLNKKHFSSFLKDFHWSNKNIFFFLESKSSTLNRMLFGIPVSKYALNNKKVLKHLNELVSNVYHTFPSYGEIIIIIIIIKMEYKSNKK